MKGLRGYDVLMNSPLMHGNEEWPKFQKLWNGAPLFLADSARVCYQHTAKEGGGRLRMDELPPITLPFDRFIVDWYVAREHGADCWRCVCCERSPRGMTAVVFTCMTLPTSRTGVTFDSRSVVTLGPAGEIGPIDCEWSADNFDDEAARGANAGLGIALFTLGLLGVKNVSRIESALPRAIRRHPGIFARTASHKHYVLDIPGATQFRESIGADESESALRRLHIVRGHFADYREGAGLFGKLHGRYYIAPHVRGSATVGTVTKDYRVRAVAATEEGDTNG